ncbi:hypothetical protein [Halalkalirubrum salinum]|uniref:hypothetical protein n=1 Tax=Halalkalirubrum salinum TaxID=2563889 RepID=UPI0010FB5B9B|nr:hypothetical protein [Halalkalirubrum salinum]
MTDGDSGSEGEGEGFEDGIGPSAPEPSGEYQLQNLGNIKSEWEATTIYLPADLKSAVELAYRRSSYECKRESGYDMQKLQDFYPLLIAMGLNNLNRSGTEDILTLLAYVQSEYGADM